MTDAGRGLAALLAMLVLPLATPAAGEAIGLRPDMDDNPMQAMFLADRLEWQDAREGSAIAWDIQAWVGKDENRLLLRAEGERVDGATEENRVELLWWRPVASHWNVVSGLRQEFEPASPRTYVAVGVMGLAPGWVSVEATAWFGEGGRGGAGIEAETEWLLTQRLILVPRVELEAWTREDKANGIGDGPRAAAFGLRLQYEIHRKFAPYAGAEWTGLLGDTADLARAAGDDVRGWRWVAGLAFWF